MPRVLIIVNRFNIGGQVSNAALIAKYLPEKYETMIIGGDIEPGEDSSIYWLEELNLKPVIIKEMKREISFKHDKLAYKKVKEIIQEFKPDIVHTHAAKAGAIGRLAAKATNVPVIIHTYHGHVFHSYFGKLKTLFYKTIERYLASISSKIIVLSKQQQHEICDTHKICKQSKTEIIPLGFDLEKFYSNQEEKRNSFRKQYLVDDFTICIGIIGRLTDIKNHKLFINCAKQVLISLPNKKIKFFIIGDGELMQDLQQQAVDLKLNIDIPNTISQESKIVFTSWIKEVDWVLAGLDVVALTSKNEGTPVTLIEAQAAGKFIVSTDVGGIKDIVIENETALLSPSNDIQKLSQNIIKLTENQASIASKGIKGIEHSKKMFTYYRLINDIDKLYSYLLQN